MQISIPGTGIAGLGRDHPEQGRGRALVHGPGDTAILCHRPEGTSRNLLSRDALPRRLVRVPAGIRDGSSSLLPRPCGTWNAPAHSRFTLDYHMRLSRWPGTTRLCLGR